LKLDSHYSDGSKTYQLKAQYNYQYLGVEYQSDQVGISVGSDNIGSYHEDLYQKLRNQNHHTAWVDPENPHQAVLDRELRWGMIAFRMIFVLVFGGAGFGLIYYAYYSKKKNAQKASLMQSSPEQPWKWDSQWQGKEISPNTKSSMFAIGIFALFWNIIAIPSGVIVLLDTSKWKHDPFVLLVLLFPLIGIALISSFVFMLVRHKRYKATRLVLRKLPVRRGERFKASIVVPSHIAAEKGYKITLTAWKSIWVRGNKGGRSRRRETIWQQDVFLKSETYPWDKSRTQLDFEFLIPTDIPETNDPDEDIHYDWDLEVHADIPGIDFKLTFPVPVFGLNPSTENGALVEMVKDSSQDDDIPWDSFKIEHQYNPLSQHESWQFGLGRNLGSLIGILLFDAIFIGVGLLIISKGDIFFGSVFALFGGGIGLLFTANIAYRSKIEMTPLGIKWEGGAVLLSRKTFTPDQIRSIQLKDGMRVNGRLLHQIRLQDQQGKYYILAKGIPSQTAAEQIITKLSTLR
ncbi:MAG: DUF3592 domain-containing protein, partial [bacterium]